MTEVILLTEVNLEAAAAFGQRHGKRSDGSPPPADSPRPPLEVQLESLTASVRRTRTGIGVVLAVIFPGLGLVFAGSYASGLAFGVSYVAAIVLAAAYSWWIAFAAGLLWLVNVAYTATLLSGE